MMIRKLAAAAIGAMLMLGGSAFAESDSRPVAIDAGKTTALTTKADKKKSLVAKTDRRKNFATKETKKLTAREARKAKAKAEAQAALEARNRPLKPLRLLKPLRPIERQVTERRVNERPIEVAAYGNSGELRSEGQPRGNVFNGFFDGEPSLLPQTRALDAALDQRQSKKNFTVKADYEPQTVAFSGYQKGTIVIDTSAKYLYLVESSNSARRYAIAVGREGLLFTGEAKVGDKQEWPRWIPTLDMQKREPKKYGQYKDGMNGGPDNPLGARAIYLYQGNQDTHIRIHGTNQPETIGTASSNGCFRMVNDHVKDLYGRVGVGTNVVVVRGLS